MDHSYRQGGGQDQGNCASSSTHFFTTSSRSASHGKKVSPIQNDEGIIPHSPAWHASHLSYMDMYRCTHEGAQHWQKQSEEIGNSLIWLIRRTGRRSCSGFLTLELPWSYPRCQAGLSKIEESPHRRMPDSALARILLEVLCSACPGWRAAAQCT